MGNAYCAERTGAVTSSYPSEPFNLWRIAETYCIYQLAVFVRTEILMEVVQLDVDLQASIDYDLWIRMGKRFAKRIFFLEEYLAISRMSPGNETLTIYEFQYKTEEYIFLFVSKNNQNNFLFF